MKVGRNDLCPCGRGTKYKRCCLEKDRMVSTCRCRRTGAYRLEPELWEFWQHRDSRLHDRFRYRP